MLIDDKIGGRGMKVLGEKSYEIKKIAILGAGIMGPGIAQSLAMGGYDVTMWTRSEATMEKAKLVLHKGLETFAEEGMLTDSVESVYRRIDYKYSITEAIEGSDLVLETIIENVDAKRNLYVELGEIVGKDVIVASNTSALNIFDIVPEKLLPQQLITHWYGPAQLIPLVEVVKSEDAPMEMVRATMDMLKKCGKEAVFMDKFIRGYIVNRILQCLNREIFYLLDNGYCTPEDIDRACRASFIPRAMVLGLCKKMDFGGLDLTVANFDNKSYILPEFDGVPQYLADLVGAGNLGVKTGKGFYEYEGIDMVELLAKRDKQIFEVFKLSKELMDDSV